MDRSLAIVAWCLLAGCTSSQPESDFVRITTDTGRVYYANHHRTLHSESGGFLSFRDLITKESVRLKNGTYEAKFCPRDEVSLRQVEYLRNPTRPPQREDYDSE